MNIHYRLLHGEQTSPNELARYVQPRYRQYRGTIITKLQACLAGQGPYPQLVDPSILRTGDEITLVRAIETLPFRKVVIGHIALNMEYPAQKPEAWVEVEHTHSLTDPDSPADFPRLVQTTSLGFAELSDIGTDDPGYKYFSYVNAFLSDCPEVHG